VLFSNALCKNPKRKQQVKPNKAHDYSKHKIKTNNKQKKTKTKAILTNQFLK